ncbi:PKD domain-containing protein [bacterium]|nr:PKD domain-containing protein [bacterium]
MSSRAVYSRQMPILSLLCLVICLLVCNACASGGGRPEGANTVAGLVPESPGAGPSDNPAPASRPGFAPPLELLRQSSTTPANIERLRGYNYWDQTLPNARMDQGKFLPAGDGGPDRLDQAAYCIYRFEQLDTYDTPQQLLFSWVTDPQVGQLYIGLSDFSSNRWEWHQPQDLQKLSLDSFAPYISASGSTLVAVLITGSQEAQIEWMIAGGSVVTTLQISSDLNSDPSQNLAPLEVSFDAYTNSLGATISTYEWDFDDDGVIDQSGPETQASHSFPDPGFYTVMLRATTADGTQETDYLQFTAVDPGNTGPTAQTQANPLVSDAPAEITLDASASSDPDGQIIRYEWDFNNDGVYDHDSGNDSIIGHIFARKGLNFYKVRVTDNDYASATALGAVTINSGWLSSTVGFGYDYIDGLTACTCGTGAAARPCIAFHTPGTSNLHFVRAAAADGSDWEAVQNPVDNSGSVGFSPALLRSPLSGNALLFYGDFNTSTSRFKLRLAKAGNAEGTSWSAPIDIETELSVGHRTCAFLDNGMPALLSWSLDLGNSREIYYYRAGDASAQDWNIRHLAASAPDDGFFTSLAAACSAMPVAFVVNDSNQYGFSGAESSDRQDWSGFTAIEALNCPQVCALEVAGRPAFAAVNGSRILYRRADNAEGSSWPAEAIAISGPETIYPACMKILNGAPALAWLSADGDGVYLVRSIDAVGGSWSMPVNIVPGTGLGDALDMTECDGNPVVIYSNEADDTIEAAFFTS